MSIKICNLVDIPTVKTDTSDLGYFETGFIDGFSIQRIYYLYSRWREIEN